MARIRPSGRATQRTAPALLPFLGTRGRRSPGGRRPPGPRGPSPEPMSSGTRFEAASLGDCGALHLRPSARRRVPNDPPLSALVPRPPGNGAYEMAWSAAGVGDTRLACGCAGTAESSATAELFLSDARGEPLAALEAAPGEHPPAGLGGHPQPEPMGPLARDVAGLKGALHDPSPFSVFDLGGREKIGKAPSAVKGLVCRGRRERPPKNPPRGQRPPAKRFAFLEDGQGSLRGTPTDF